MSAASDINDFIQKAQSIADIERTNAEQYAQEAVQAVDSIKPLSIGTSLSYSPGSGFKTVDVPVIPKIDVNTDDFNNVYNLVSTKLVNAFTGFFTTAFGGGDTQAIAMLGALAMQGEKVAEQMLARLGTNNGAEGITYLKGHLDTTRARNYLDEGFEVGRAVRTTMQTKANGGSPAVTYLLGRFNAGDAAATQLITMLTSGGTGLPASLEDQVWERDRSRILKEAARTKTAVVSGMASRGFPLPPGAMISVLEMTEADSQDKISAQSSTVAIKQIETYIDNIKTAAQLAVQSADTAGAAILQDSSVAGRALLEDAQAGTRLTIEDAREAARLLIEDSVVAMKSLLENATQASTQVIKLRSEAANAAASYISALARAPEAGAAVASALASARSSTLTASASYYSAQASAITSYNNAYAQIERLKLDAIVEPARLAVQENATLNQTLVGVANAKANATLGAATAVGNMGAAALSSLNAIASLSSAG